MKPFVYGGFDPATLFWIFIGSTVLLLLFFIYEENFTKVYWGKGSVIRLIVISTIWVTALAFYIVADVNKNGGLEEANAKVLQSIEAKGVKVASSEIDVTAGKQSTVRVELPAPKEATDKKLIKTENCAVIAPKDTSKDIEILCGETANGMSLDNLIKWNEAGQPEDKSPYENKAEDTKRIMESIN